MRGAWLLLALPASASAERLGCTALAIDGGASVTGSAFAVENTDCNVCDFRLNYVPPRKHAAGELRPVFLNPPNYPRWVGYGRGEIYHPLEGQNLSRPIGHIPQVASTFGYYESINPLMNDQGLGVGESSCAAMLQNRAPHTSVDVPGPVGIIDAMTMQQLALERCATARCAVELLGSLAERYGYLPFGGEPTQGLVDGRPMWADSGEAFTFADAGGEAWVLNMLGGVEGVVKSVWAAQRLPKGHVAVIANEFTMGELPEEPTEDFLFARDIRKAAIAAGLWDGRGALDFSQVFAPDPTKYSTNGNPPIPLYSSLRRWRLLNLANPSLDLKFQLDHRRYPFSVPVEAPISHLDVMAMMRDHYAGTEFDMTQGVLAGPYRTPFRVEGGPSRVGDPPRGISILRTLYSTISETGPNDSVVWYAPDTPATSVYVPLDHRVAAVAPTFKAGRHEEFSRGAAWWAFNFVNNWMQLNYEGMSTEDVLPQIKAWQGRIDAERAQAKQLDAGRLSKWQEGLQEELAASWWRLADFLVMKWSDMARTADGATDKAVGYPEWWAKLVGFSHDVHPVWVQPAAAPNAACPNYVAASVTLPRAWDSAGGRWVEWGPLEQGLAASRSSPWRAPEVLLGLALFAAAGALAGFALGRRRGAGEDPKARYLLA